VIHPLRSANSGAAERSFWQPNALTDIGRGLGDAWDLFALDPLPTGIYSGGISPGLGKTTTGSLSVSLQTARSFDRNSWNVASRVASSGSTTVTKGSSLSPLSLFSSVDPAARFSAIIRLMISFTFPARRYSSRFLAKPLRIRSITLRLSFGRCRVTISAAARSERSLCHVMIRPIRISICVSSFRFGPGRSGVSWRAANILPFGYRSRRAWSARLNSVASSGIGAPCQPGFPTDRGRGGPGRENRLSAAKPSRASVDYKLAAG
jgi:hypothetical protein